MNEAPLNPRTRALLEAPILPTLLRLGAPNVLVMLSRPESASSRPTSSAGSARSEAICSSSVRIALLHVASQFEHLVC